MQLVDVFGLLFGRNAADFAALLPGGALGTAAPAARWLLLAWFVLPLLAMWVLIFHLKLTSVQIIMQIRVAAMMPLMYRGR